MNTILEVDLFIKELQENVVMRSNKNDTLNEMRKQKKFINKSVNSPKVQKRVDEYNRKLNLLRYSNINFYLCLLHNKEYYLDLCIDAIELLGDLTIKFNNGSKYDERKNILWDYVGHLVEDKEMIDVKTYEKYQNKDV